MTTPESGWEKAIQADILVNSNAVHRLYTKGARTILIQGQFSDDRFPLNRAFFDTNMVLRLKYRQAFAHFNERFLESMQSYSRNKPELRLLYFDMGNDYEAVLASPSSYGFSTVDVDALSDMGL